MGKNEGMGFGGILSKIEEDSWKERNAVQWSVVITYHHGGRRYSFNLETAETTDHQPYGINDFYIKEIADALPKRLKPLSDGLHRGFELVASRIEKKGQRKF